MLRKAYNNVRNCRWQRIFVGVTDKPPWKLWRDGLSMQGIAILITVFLSQSAAAETESGMQQLRLAVDVAIGRPAASLQSQCRVIAIGVKSCGGPREYLVYSTEVTETQTLHDLVNEYNRCDRDRNERLGLMSDCEFVEEPAVVLNNGICERASLK